MTDTTTVTTTTTTPAVEPTPESFFQHIIDFFKHEVTDLETALVGLENSFEADVWPFVKSFLITLASQEGQVALKAAVAAAPLLLTGGFAAAAISVGEAVVSTAGVNAAADAAITLGQVQAALQVVKVANGTVTAGDAATVAAIQAATVTATAPAVPAV